MQSTSKQADYYDHKYNCMTPHYPKLNTGKYTQNRAPIRYVGLGIVVITRFDPISPWTPLIKPASTYMYTHMHKSTIYIHVNT